MPADILIVDDEADIRDLVAGILEDEGHSARLARDSDEALRAIEERRPHLVILDIWLQGSRLDGLEVLSYIKRSYPELPVVIISGHGNIETAVTAIKRGRLRLHREAVQGRPPDPRHAAGARGLSAEARGQGAAESARASRPRWSASRPRSTSCATPSTAWPRPTAASSSADRRARARSLPPASSI